MRGDGAAGSITNLDMSYMRDLFRPVQARPTGRAVAAFALMAVWLLGGLLLDQQGVVPGGTLIAMGVVLGLMVLMSSSPVVHGWLITSIKLEPAKASVAWLRRLYWRVQSGARSFAAAGLGSLAGSACFGAYHIQQGPDASTSDFWSQLWQAVGVWSGSQRSQRSQRDG